VLSVLARWRREIAQAVPTAGLVIVLFYRWFSVRDRYEVFLYYHRMGAGFDTAPFGWVTVSRYWMAGLVAAGAVLVAQGIFHVIAGRVVREYHAPPWRRLWPACAVPLAIAIPAIVMAVNEPTLPLANAAQVTLATLLGLAVATKMAQLLARGPGWALRLAIDGLALACLLSGLRAVEFMRRWLASANTVAISRALAVLAAGAVFILLMTAFYRWRRRVVLPGVQDLLVAGLAVHYLVLPLYHHLFWCKDSGSWTDPDYFTYIPDADNYLARSWLLQLGIWVAVALLVAGVTWLRRRLRHAGRPAGRVATRPYRI
jgi:hypothetical protein